MSEVMAPAIDLIKERREEIRLEIRRLTNLVVGLDMALEILEAKPARVATLPASNEVEKINMPAAASADTERDPSQPPRKRKTADERKEEVAALLEQEKSVEEIAAATGLKESSVKLYCSILKARTKELPGCEAATPEDDEDERPEPAETSTGAKKRHEPGEEDEIDEKIRELHALKLTDQQMADKIGKSEATICHRRNKMGLPSNGKKGPPRGPRRSGKSTEEGEYPIIGGTQENPVYGSMRMKVVEEKIVDGHKVKVLPPGYADGVYPQKNVSVRP
jgi:hypothetical protein